MKEQFYNQRWFNRYRRWVIPTKFPAIRIIHASVEDNQKGGMTLIRYWIDKNCVITGIAWCCTKDTYDKQKGRSIAFGRLMRAIKKLGISKSQLNKHRKYVESRIGKINRFLAGAAYLGDHIE